jgi:hypothetical protein
LSGAGGTAEWQYRNLLYKLDPTWEYSVRRKC